MLITFSLYLTGPSTPTPPITPETTVPSLPPPPGCWHNGIYYQPGEVIKEERGKSGIICSTTICDKNNEIMVGDNFNCEATTTLSIPTVSTVSIVTTSPQIGCWRNGVHYQHDEVIEEEKGESGEICSQTICVYDRIKVKDFNCTAIVFPSPIIPESPTPTTPETPAPSPSSASPSTPAGCWYDDIYYQPGELILELNRRSSKYCYKLFCGKNNKTYRDYTGCEGVTPTPTAPPPTAAKSKP